MGRLGGEVACICMRACKPSAPSRRMKLGSEAACCNVLSCAAPACTLRREWASGGAKREETHSWR